MISEPRSYFISLEDGRQFAFITTTFEPEMTVLIPASDAELIRHTLEPEPKFRQLVLEPHKIYFSSTTQQFHETPPQGSEFDSQFLAALGIEAAHE